MTSEPVLMHQQEVRRQAMLQAMQLDVWLPRQQLLNAAQSRDYLLEWQAVDEVTVVPAKSGSKPAASRSAAAAVPENPASTAPIARQRGAEYVSVRDKLALVSSPPKPTVVVVSEATSTETAQSEQTSAAVSAEPIPRFALQLLRADNCLILVDLPTGEPFQSRDPDYQLLKDMLRAAGLTDKPSFMRQGAPITWPMLHSGDLMHEQNATEARACVRDLLSVELHSAPALCIWLLGEQAVRFANAADAAPLYKLQLLAGEVQLWSLPSLESVLEQPLLKRDIWHSMCAVRSLWQVSHG